MRVVTSTNEEKYIVCPNCKRLLAYTEQDINELIKRSDKIFKVSSYIDCPVCSYQNLVNYTEYNCGA